LTDDRIRLLNQIDFVWEAQRGGPRRKRKATVAVPPRAKPRNVEQTMAVNLPRRQGGLLPTDGERVVGGLSESNQPDMRSAVMPFASLPTQHSLDRGALLEQAVRRDAFGHLGSWNLLNFGAYQQSLQAGIVPPMATNFQPFAGSPYGNLQQRLSQQLPASFYLNSLQNLPLARPTLAEREDLLRLQLLRSLGVTGNLQHASTSLGEPSFTSGPDGAAISRVAALHQSSTNRGQNQYHDEKQDSSDSDDP
jgi:hypothetical protein